MKLLNLQNIVHEFWNEKATIRHFFSHLSTIPTHYLCKTAKSLKPYCLVIHLHENLRHICSTITTLRLQYNTDLYTVNSIITKVQCKL